ncbi:hypothetical protein [Tardiphaga sp.]|jgi:hypothetical protein|uniref:hypothetical protein n=1 Tax=Tardiphaga sp. TaxID=1926292 RepID=UPI0037DA632A
MTKRAHKHAPDLFSDLDSIIRELGKLHRIVGTRLVVDPEKVRLLRNASTGSRASVTKKKSPARRLTA